MIAWTDEQVARLHELHEQKVPARQIAVEFGCTRNAIIGKLSRLGLSKPTTQRAPAVRRFHRARPAPRITLAETVEVSDDVVPSAPHPLASPSHRPPGPCGLLDLTDDHCRWPLGEPGDEDFYFCGEAVAAHPYCAEHARVSRVQRGVA